MTEDFLHYLWHHRLFYPSGLVTVNGSEPVEVLHPGWPNHHAGPDFFNSRIRIGTTTWAGNVEIHLHSSDWFRHGHDLDPSYNNVVLHVVAHHDGEPVLDSNKRQVPELVLSFPDNILQQYDALIHHTGVVKCLEHVGRVGRLDWQGWLDRMLCERMEQRADHIFTLLEEFNSDWDQVFFVLLARSMGFGVNGDPFEMLARNLPVKVVLRHASDLLQLEALLFGQAGFLNQMVGDESYPTLLQREYNLLRHKYGLKPMEVSLWKFLRLRPVNFPTIRLAQLAAILYKNSGNFESWVKLSSIGSLMERLDVAASGYWKSHFMFNRSAKSDVRSHLGKNSRELIIANAMIPFIFTMALRRGQTEIQTGALKLLSQLPVEHNNILDHWKRVGVVPENEGEAQALIHLVQNYCTRSKCLHCRIGHLIINGTATNS